MHDTSGTTSLTEYVNNINRPIELSSTCTQVMANDVSKRIVLLRASSVQSIRGACRRPLVPAVVYDSFTCLGLWNHAYKPSIHETENECLSVLTRLVG